MKSLPITSVENALVGLEELRNVHMRNDPMNGDGRRFPNLQGQKNIAFSWLVQQNQIELQFYLR